MTHTIERILPTDIVIALARLRQILLKPIPILISIAVDPFKASLDSIEILFGDRLVPRPSPVLVEQNQEKNGRVRGSVEWGEDRLAENRRFPEPDLVKYLPGLLFSA